LNTLKDRVADPTVVNTVSKRRVSKENLSLSPEFVEKTSL
jgi:hypothetical protein